MDCYYHYQVFVLWVDAGASLEVRMGNCSSKYTHICYMSYKTCTHTQGLSADGCFHLLSWAIRSEICQPEVKFCFPPLQFI